MARENDEWYDFLGVKLPKRLMEAMDEYIRRDTHATRSEFVRNAIREKLNRETPDIIKKILAEKEVVPEDIS